MKQELMRYMGVLRGCNLFRDMDDDALSKALEGMQARAVKYAKGTIIYRPGEMVREASVVLEGIVAVEANDDEGDKTNLNMLRSGEEFGTYLLFSGREKGNMYVYAQTDCVVLMLDILRFRKSGDISAATWRLFDNLLLTFAEKCIDLYSRVQIYGKKRIRSRIRMYLMTLEERDGAVTLPTNRTALAAFLGVDRTALAREMTRMQEEGIISVNKRRVQLLDRDFFQPAPGRTIPARD